MKNALIILAAHLSFTAVAHAQAWGARTAPPVPPSLESRLVKGAGRFYYAPGASPQFFSYDPTTNAWAALADAPADFTLGTDLCEFKFMELAADFEPTLLIERYDIAGDFWGPLPSPGVPFGPGSQIAPMTDGLLLFRGMGTPFVRRYHELSGTWSNGASAPVPIPLGTVACPGPGNRILLFIPGETDAHVYDATLDSWSLGIPLPGPAVGPGASADLGPDLRILYYPGSPEPGLYKLDPVALTTSAVLPGPVGLPSGVAHVISDTGGDFLLTPAAFESNVSLAPPPPPASCGCADSEAEAAGCSAGSTRGNLPALMAALGLLLYARLSRAAS